MKIAILTGSFALAIAAGFFWSGDAIKSVEPSGVSKLTGQEAVLEKNCSKTMAAVMKDVQRSVPNAPANFNSALGSRLKKSCTCIAQKALDGRPKKEAKLIASVLPLFMAVELGSKQISRQYSPMIRAAKTSDQKKRIRKKSRRARSQQKKQFLKVIDKKIRKAGMNRKRALGVLKDAHVVRLGCLRGMTLSG